MDVLSTKARSAIMARIHPTNNKTTEITLAELMRAAKIVGWRRQGKLFGRPDFVFRKERLVVFVDGCFWHGCARCRSIPEQNRAFWEAKFSYNKLRARKVNAELSRQGWRVLRV